MLDIIIQTYMALTLFDDTLTKRVRQLRLEAFQKLYSILKSYEEQFFVEWLIQDICLRKCAFIMQASSKKEISAILEPSMPRYNGGSFQASSEYHIEEEELIIW